MIDERREFRIIFVVLTFNVLTCQVREPGIKHSVPGQPFQLKLVCISGTETKESWDAQCGLWGPRRNPAPALQPTPAPTTLIVIMRGRPITSLQGGREMEGRRAKVCGREVGMKGPKPTTPMVGSMRPTLTLTTRTQLTTPTIPMPVVGMEEVMGMKGVGDYGCPLG